MQNAETIQRPARKSKGQRGLVILTMIVLVLVGIGWMWWSRLTATPVVTIPMPTMPSPNAFDLITQACNNIQDEKAVGEAISTRPVAGQHVYTQAEKEALVAKNAGALKELRAAFAHAYMHPPARSINAIFPHFAKQRSMARLLALESQVYASRGEWGRAMNSDLDALELGITVPRGAVLIGQLVGVACEAIGRKGAWEKVDKLSASEAKAAVRRLEKMMAKRFPFADTMEEEKRFGQAALMEMFRDPNWRGKSEWVQMFNSSGGGDFGEKVEEVSLKARLYLYSNGTIFNNYSGYLDRLIARERQPYVVQGPPPSFPNDPISNIFLPVFEQAGVKDRANQAQDALLSVALALRAYRVEQGAYPQKLDELAPKYLTQLPEDPFGQGMFLYKQTGDKYLLYSVGPDKVDDGGRPIDDPSKASGSNANARYLIQLDSKGDVLVGVNKF
jgi:hypothetical protein